METADRRIACGRCGAEFGCGRDGPAGCWCAEESFPLKMPLPADAGSFSDCLCPSCLRSVADTLTTARISPD